MSNETIADNPPPGAQMAKAGVSKECLGRSPRYERVVRFGRFLKQTIMALAVMAIVVGCPLAVWKGWPLWEHWYRDRLASQLSEQIDQAEDREAKVLVHQLASLGVPAYEELMAAAVSPRAPVADTSREEIDLVFAGHRSRIVTEQSYSDAEQVVVLSRALAENASHFGPQGARWAEALALKLIELADDLAVSQTTKVLNASNRVLEIIPPQGPRLRTTRTGAPSVDESSVVALQPPKIDLELLKVPSESMLVERSPQQAVIAQIPPTPEPPVVEHTEEVVNPLRQTTPKVDSKVKQMPWVTSGRSSISVEVEPPPVTPNLDGLLVVPTPAQMQQRQHALRKLPSETLLAKLPHADEFISGTIRIVLTERGMTEKEIDLARRVSDSDVNVRLQLIEEISQLPAGAARRLLRLMLKDTNADIRLRALTTLATAGDPQLSQLARQIAAQDDDPRVAELASRLMRR